MSLARLGTTYFTQFYSKPISWLENQMADDAPIKVKDLRVGDRVSYRDLENTVVQSTVRSAGPRQRRPASGFLSCKDERA